MSELQWGVMALGLLGGAVCAYWALMACLWLRVVDF